jgi:hypothetical protein
VQETDTATIYARNRVSRSCIKPSAALQGAAGDSQKPVPSGFAVPVLSPSQSAPSLGALFNDLLCLTDVVLLHVSKSLRLGHALLEEAAAVRVG